MTTKRKILAAGLILAGLVVTGFLLLSLRKSTPAFDGDLMPVRKTVADQDNAFHLLAEATAAIYWPEAKARELRNLSNGKDWNAEFATDVLAKNEKTLALLERAMTCAELQVPVVKSFDDDLPYLGEWRILANLASIQAGKLFREGKEQEALALALRVVHFGHRTEDSGGMILHYLVGSAIKQIGLSQVRQIARDTKLPPEQLIACIAKLDTYRVNAPGLTNSLKCEYRITAKTMEDLRSGKLTGTNSPFEQMTHSVGLTLSFDLDKTKKLMAQDMRVQLGRIPRHFSEMPLTELFSRSTNSSTLQLLARGNATGEILVSMSSPGWTRVLARKCQENSDVRATQLVLALKCYYTKRGRLPDALTELVPEFLPIIPLDDFDGKPLRYSRERQLIWFIGNDLIDSGGVKSTQTGGPDDVLFEIELKPTTQP